MPVATVSVIFEDLMTERRRLIRCDFTKRTKRRASAQRIIQWPAGEWRRLPVAVKTVVFQGGLNEAHATLVASEAAIASNMTHRNVVATYSHDLRNITAPNSVGAEQCIFKFYLLQEYCNGGSLGDAISDGLFGASKTRLHWRRCLSILFDIATGMAYIHSMRICHGDLNPANVLLKVRVCLSCSCHLSCALVSAVYLNKISHML
jgi:serine/threonine protein kinase